jgi:hypothetical protein
VLAEGGYKRSGRGGEASRSLRFDWAKCQYHGEGRNVQVSSYLSSLPPSPPGDRSRVGLTEGWRLHSSGCGDVLSSWAPTAPAMVLQCSGWWHNDGDGCTGPKVTEETYPSGPTSRRCPARARDRCLYFFRGFRRPLSRGAAWRSYRSGWHSVTELILALPHSSRTVPGIASQGGLAEQRRDMIPRRCQRAGVAGIRLLTRTPTACKSI